MSSAPKHRHEMTLRVGGNTNSQLADRLRRIADDLELHDIDGPREVVSSEGYWFTTQHSPRMDAERYDADLKAWAERRRALPSKFAEEADRILAAITTPNHQPKEDA